MLWCTELRNLLNKNRIPQKIGSGLGGYVDAGPIRYPQPQPATLVTASTFYLLSGSTPTGLTLPSGAFGAWTDFNSNASGANTKSLSTTSGTSQVTLSVSQGSVGKNATRALGVCQYCSVALAAGSYSAGNWTFAFAAKTGITGSFGAGTWIGRAGLYLVNGSDGTSRTSIFDVATFGASRTNITQELTVYSVSISGAAFSPVAGDYLAFECGTSTTNGNVGTITISINVYDSGTTAITSDNTVASDAQSLITSPVPITLQ